MLTIQKPYKSCVSYIDVHDADGLETLLTDPELLLPIPEYPKYRYSLIKSPPLLAPPTTPPNSQKPTKPGASPAQKTPPATENYINLSPYKTQDGESNGWIPLEQI